MKTKLSVLILALLMTAGAGAQTVQTSGSAPTTDGCILSRDGVCVNLYTKGNGGTVNVGATTTGADAVANTAVSSITGTTNNPLGVSGYLFNGATWDRLRGNTNGIFVGTPQTAADAIANTAPVSPGSANAPLMNANYIFNGTTWDRKRSIINSTDSVGTGIQAVGLVGQLDDTAPSTVTENQFGNVRIDARHRLMVTTAQPTTFFCTVPVSTATTIQAVGGSCAAPGAGLSLYITDIKFDASASGIAADAFPTLKYGTGGTCGVGTTVFWGTLSAAAVNAVDNRTQPIKIPANNEICWINSTAGSKFLIIGGYIAP